MRTIGLFSICFTLIVGCGGASPDEATNTNPSNDTGPSLDTGSGPFDDTGSPSSDTGAPSTDGAPGCGSTDEPDDDGADSNCDGADGKVGFDVYVSPSGLDTNEGTPTSPKATLRSALEKARVTGGSVLLSTGEYTPDALEGTIGSGTWRVVGGYDKTFKGKVNRERTTLKVPATGLSIAGTGTDAVLQHLQIVADSPGSDEHRSAYAMRVSVEKLRLDDVLVSSGNARDGKNGEIGAAGEGGSPPRDENVSTRQKPTVCKGAVQPDWTMGSDTMNAEGLPAGSSTTKLAGGNGSAGAPGRDGENAAKSPTLVEGMLEWASGTSGLADGKPGYGGAGAAPKTWFSTYLNASGGGGGCPGEGGTGATSGGGSIAIVVLAGELSITRGVIETGIAGSGGDGGAGGAGGPAARGGYPPGATSDCVQEYDMLLRPTRDCSAYGGRGGAGGAGGRGGGGAGGWTIGIVKVGTAKADVDPATTFKLGAPGAGGLGKNGGYAPNGDRVREYVIAK